MSHPFRVILSDPPWKFSDKLPGKGRGAAKHYECMSLADIEAFPLPETAPDAHLFLWRVASMQEEALRVVRAWGFTPKTEIIWLKTTKTGKRHFGMGRTVRASHEACIVAVKGKPRVQSRSVRSVFEAPVGRHSEKPDAFFDLVEELCDGPYVELFSRRLRAGWTCLGNEVE